MSGFNRFYLWGVKMKYHMSIYTVAGIFFKAVVNALQGCFACKGNNEKEQGKRI